MREPMLLKNRKAIENYKKLWCIIIIYLTANISLLFILFYPALMDSRKFAIYQFNERPNYFKFLTYLLISIFFPTLVYIQCYVMCCVFYGLNIINIFNYKLMDYIDQNLCKKYRTLNTIEMASEQIAVSTHLKECAKFHLHLRR